MRLEPYLSASDVINWRQPEVSSLARRLRGKSDDPLEIARQSFEWVRDNIEHCSDFARDEVPCRASEVLQAGTGFCYAKSHLLAALLRANRIATGLCYQRLSLDGGGPPFCLHGLNAIYLEDHGWYRVDPRGDNAEIKTACSPPVERLAFCVTLPGEADLPEIWPEPLPLVAETLQTATSARELATRLPDIPLIDSHR